MNDIRLVSVTETEGRVCTRYEWDTGAATVWSEKAPAPAMTLLSPLAAMHRFGSREIARLEQNAATAGEADEIAFAWDQEWGT